MLFKYVRYLYISIDTIQLLYYPINENLKIDYLLCKINGFKNEDIAHIKEILL